MNTYIMFLWRTEENYRLDSIKFPPVHVSVFIYLFHAETV